MNYSFSAFWSKEDKGYIAVCPEFPGLSAWGETAADAIKEAHVALELYIEEYEESGVALPEPTSIGDFSGQTRLRMPSSLHATLARRAEEEGVSLNTYMVFCLSHAAGEDDAGRRFETVAMQLIQQSIQMYQGMNDIQKGVRMVMGQATSDSDLPQDPTLRRIKEDSMRTT